MQMGTISYQGTAYIVKIFSQVMNFQLKAPQNAI